MALQMTFGKEPEGEEGEEHDEEGQQKKVENISKLTLKRRWQMSVCLFK